VNRTLSAVLLAALLASGALVPGAAQPPRARPADDQLRKVRLPGEARETLGRLQAADRLLEKKAWAEGVDDYLRLIYEAGDDLVPELLPHDQLASARRSVQLRRLCHARIAALPAPGLAHYRSRVEGPAKRWLGQGAELRDVKLLRRVVDEAFCSRAAEKALDLLGELAFERGHFAEARGWWRLLALPPTEAAAEATPRPGALRFPDPQGDVARVRARQVLALLFQGEVRRAAEELRAFRKLHGQAAGALAGRAGKYAETLWALLAERRKVGPLSPEETDWPTFAGSPSRNRVLDTGLAVRLWAEGPAWRVRLDSPEAEGDGPGGEHPEPRAAPARRLAFHPVIAGGRVLVADARFVTAYDLRTGKRLCRHDFKAPGRPGLDHLRLKLPAPPDLRYTLSAAEGRVYVRLGAPLLAPQGPDGPRLPQPASYLACLELPGGAAGQPAACKERWVVKARAAEGADHAFEGAPLVHDGRVYAAETCWRGGRIRTAVCCRDADDGGLLWRREVCDSPDLDEDPAPRARHHLLTLAGTAVVYCSHSGAVVSLDALTGARLWAVRYPRRAGGPPLRDLAPCVAVGSRVLVAPNDSDRVYCLDAETGRVVWERVGVVPAHVLGVSRGRLVFTTADGIRALDAATGADEGGWRQPAVGGLPPFGRGLLVGGWVLWPTQDPRLPLRALNDEDGSQRRGPVAIDPTRLHRLQPGNMAFGGGWLVVAGTEELVGYGSKGESPALPLAAKQ
jgi:cellulose synthase operon protein C